MLFPIGDDDRHLSRPGYVTYLLIALNVLGFAYFQGCGADDAFTYGYSAVPLELTTGEDLTRPVTRELGGEMVTVPHEPGPAPIYLTVLFAMFMHGGYAHLGGNLLYLWIFGDNVEVRFGALPFLAFYLVSGLAATLAQVALDPGSVIPTLGASGAISGVLGAYLVLFPKNRVHTLVLFHVIAVPALVAIGLWFALQFVNGLGAIAATEQTGGVAYGAHIGGFVAGAALALAMRLFVKTEPDSALRRAAQRDPRSHPLFGRS
jgi:membrane associated rhomboid family serine protease